MTSLRLGPVSGGLIEGGEPIVVDEADHTEGALAGRIARGEFKHIEKGFARRQTAHRMARIEAFAQGVDLGRQAIDVGQHFLDLVRVRGKFRGAIAWRALLQAVGQDADGSQEFGQDGQGERRGRERPADEARVGRSKSDGKGDEKQARTRGGEGEHLAPPREGHGQQRAIEPKVRHGRFEGAQIQAEAGTMHDADFPLGEISWLTRRKPDPTPSRYLAAPFYRCAPGVGLHEAKSSPGEGADQDRRSRSMI